MQTNSLASRRISVRTVRKSKAGLKLKGEGHAPKLDWRDSELITDGQRCQCYRVVGAKSLTQKSYTKNAGGSPAALSSRFVSGLYRLYIFGLPPFGALDHVKLYLLTLLQTTKSACLYRREVYEHVLAALTANETIAFGIVKPLYCSCFHGVARFLFVRYALCPSQNYIRQVTLSRELLKLQKSNAAGLYRRYSPVCQTISLAPS